MATSAPSRKEKLEKMNVPVTDCSDAEILDMLRAARIWMLLNHPFYGNVATSLVFADATDWLPTLATDGKHIYYNRNFVVWLSHQERAFGIAHELLHCIYDHFEDEVRQGRNPTLLNMAGDYSINYELVASGFKKIAEDKIKILYDHKYAGKHTLEIYDLLKQEMEEALKDVSEFSEGKRGQGFDVHVDEMPDGIEQNGSEGDGTANGGGSDNVVKAKGGPFKYSEKEKEEIKEQLKRNVIDAAKVAKQQGGTLPGGVARIVKELTEPKLNWREFIAARVQSMIKNDYTMFRPSRKSENSGFILPGMAYDDTIDIAIGLDMSSSIGQREATEMISEVKGIMEQYMSFKIYLFCFDTAVYNPQTFDESNLDDILDYELKGGGGTDFDCCYNHLKEVDIQPQTFIMFTDGYPCGSWGDAHYCDTLFVIHNPYRGKCPIAPFGVTLEYEEAAISEAA